MIHMQPLARFGLALFCLVALSSPEANLPAPSVVRAGDLSDSIVSAQAHIATDGTARNVEILGHIGGSVNAVSVQGNYAFVGMGPELAVLDVTIPGDPRRVGYLVLEDMVADVYVANGYAYVTLGASGMDIVDVSNLARPVVAGFYRSPGGAGAIVVVGRYACIAAGGDGLRVVDVSNPMAPIEVGSYQTPQPILDVEIANNYVLVTTGPVYPSSGELRVLDVSNPAAPVEVGSYGYGGHVAVAGNYAYVAAEEDGLHVVDISDPAALTEVSVYTTTVPSNPWVYFRNVAVAGHYAYILKDVFWVLAYQMYLVVLDVSNPASPVQISDSLLNGDTQEVLVADHYVYIASGWAGLRIVDVAQPTAPVEVRFNQARDFATAVAAANGYVYVGAGQSIGTYVCSGELDVVDVGNPSSPVAIGSDGGGCVSDIAVTSRYAYLPTTGRGGSLTIVDISNPAVPIQAGSYVSDTDFFGGYSTVTVADSRAYVTGFGLVLLDVSSPTNVREIARKPGYGGHVAVIGSYAYNACGDRGLCIWNAASLADIAVYQTPGSASDVVVAGNYAYIADGSAGLRVVSISNPVAPVEVGYYVTAKPATEVVVDGNYAYVGDEAGGLHVMDVSDRARPVEIAFYDSQGQMQGFAAAGGNIYVAEGGRGLFILRYNPTTSLVAALDASPRSGLAPLTVAFTDQSSGAIGWRWQFGDGATSTRQNPMHTYTTPGVYTVTLTVSGLGGSETATRANYIRAYLPQPVLASPACGTTNSNSPVISGVAPSGFTVTVYDDGTELMTTTTTVSNTFAFTPSLAVGQHVFTATATNAVGTGTPSHPLTLTVNPMLPYDPTGVTYSYPAAWGTVTGHPRDLWGCANPAEWDVWLPPLYTTTVAVPVSYTASAIVTITLGDQTRVVADLLGTLHIPLVASFNPPFHSGAFAITVTADGQTVIADGSAWIDPDGYVFDEHLWASHGLTQTLAEISVTCDYSDTAANEWMIWNAAAFDRQVNPQVTSVDGYYSFLVPPGMYRIRADQSNYWPYTSQAIVVVNKPAHINIPLLAMHRMYLPIILRRSP